jgi:frataxin-like iron-binding protein CyaY
VREQLKIIGGMDMLMESLKNLNEGTFVKLTGMKVKNDNDIFVVDSDYRLQDGRYTVCYDGRCLKKVKLNGELSNVKYNIVFLDSKNLKLNPDIKVEIVTDLKQAKKEVNNWLKGINDNEIVVTFERSENQELRNGTVRFNEYFKFGTFGDKHIGKGNLYSVKVRENNTIYLEELGKKGQKISNSRMFGCTLGLTKQILEVAEFVEKIETKKGDIKNNAVVEEIKEEPQKEVITVESVETTLEVKDATPVQTTTEGITIVYNNDKNGIEITFDSKELATEEIRTAIKSVGFRYYFKLNKWIAKQNDDTIAMVNTLFNNNKESEEIPELEQVTEVVEEIATTNSTQINKELAKCDFGYCKNYQYGDNCKKCSETAKSKGYTGCIYATFELEKVTETIETTQEIASIEEVTEQPQEQIKTEIITFINNLKNISPEETIEGCKTLLDKIDNIISNTKNDNERFNLRDLENRLKWVYASICEKIEEQQKEQTQVETNSEQVTEPKFIINEELAKRSKENMSFNDYKQGSATQEYNETVAEVAEKVNKAKENISIEASAKLDNLLLWFKKSYANWINKHNANGAKHVSVMISGASNYNMNKHNKYVSREDKLWEEYNEIMGVYSKIDTIINSDKIIKSTDKNALEKLRDKLEKAETEHQGYKEYNKQAKKEGKELYPSYVLQNSNGRIKNIKDRIAQLEKIEELKKVESKKEIEINGVKIIDNLELNRLQMIFDGKPSEEVRKQLKQNGFRWSPSNGAWQRFRGYDAERKAQMIAELIKDTKTAI